MKVKKSLEPKVSRVLRSKQKARLAYDQLSRYYDVFSSGRERRIMEEGVRTLELQPFDKILEIGCGTGHGLVLISQILTHSNNIVGVDISTGMLKQSRENLNDSISNNSSQLHQCDASHLPYANGIFSGIFLSFILDLIDTPEIPVVLSECKRVLSKEGRICVVCLEKQERTSVHIYELIHNLLPSIVDCRPIEIQKDLLNSGFYLLHFQTKMMWGLPVSIVLAKVGKNNFQGEL